jgi:starch synthase
VVDASEQNRKDGSATGFKFQATTPLALEQTLDTVIDLFQRPRIWRKMMITAMAQDYSWDKSAEMYLALYRKLT